MKKIDVHMLSIPAFACLENRKQRKITHYSD